MKPHHHVRSQTVYDPKQVISMIPELDTGMANTSSHHTMSEIPEKDSATSSSQIEKQGSAQNVNIIEAPLTKPTHRRKKSQQPTLMSTKQKQNTGVSTTTVPSNRGTFIEQPEIRFEFQNEYDSQQLRNPQQTISSTHQGVVSKEIEVIQSAMLIKEDQSQQQMDSSDKQPAAQEFNNSNLKQNQHYAQPQAPSGFKALNQVRERMHSLGGYPNAQATHIELIPSLNEICEPPNQDSVEKKSKSSQKPSPLKNASKVQEGYQPFSVHVQQYPSSQTGGIKHHKRHQTKSHFPISSLQLLQKHTNPDQQSLNVGKRGGTSNSISSHQVLPVDRASLMSHVSQHLQVQSQAVLSNQKQSKQNMQNSEMIKQLMKRHFVTTKTTNKAAYLQHAASKERGVSYTRGSSEKKKQHKSIETPSKSSTEKPESHSKTTQPSKRVTFEPVPADSSQEEDSKIEQSYAEDSEQQQHHRHQRSDYFLGNNNSSNPYQEEEDSDYQPQVTYEDSSGMQDEAPTVVIDTSLDEKDVAGQFRRLEEEDHGETAYYSGGLKESSAMSAVNNPSSIVSDNIQAALFSIRKQEEEEQQRHCSSEDTDPNGSKKKKAVTIMSIEEEEALISQINEIRERIRRGETVGQQQTIQYPKRTIEYEDEDCSPPPLMVGGQYSSSNIDYSNQAATYNAYGGEVQPDRTSFQPPAMAKPPLYSLTFAHPDLENTPLLGSAESLVIQSVNNESVPHHIKQRSFHSIDNNAANQVNCLIVTDGPNIYEKKRQRFERIQKMRNATVGGTTSTENNVLSNESEAYGTLSVNNHHQQDSQSQSYYPSRRGDEQTPNPVGSCSSLSGNYASLVKKHQAQLQQQVETESKKKTSKQKKSVSKTTAHNKTNTYSGKAGKSGTSAQLTETSQSRRQTLTSTSGIGGKSRQHSNVDHLAHSITSQSQFGQRQQQPQQFYHSTSKSTASAHHNVMMISALKAQGMAPSTSQTSRKDHQMKHFSRHQQNQLTIDHGSNPQISSSDLASHSISYKNINQQSLPTYYVSQSQRDSTALHPTSIYTMDPTENEEEELQIQLYSLRKFPQQQLQQPHHRHSIGAPVEKLKANRATTSEMVGGKKGKMAPKKSILTNHSAKRSLVVPSSQQQQYPSSFIDQQQKASHTKNTKSKNNLIINVNDGLSHQSSNSLAQSLSLQRLKTPNLKQLKQEMQTTPTTQMLRPATQGCGAPFQTIQTIRGGQQVSSVKNQNNQQHPQQQQQQMSSSYKSPFVYPQTVKYSQPTASKQYAPSTSNRNDMKIIESRVNTGLCSGSASRTNRGQRNPHHVKQKSQFIGNTQAKMVSHHQPQKSLHAPPSNTMSTLRNKSLIGKSTDSQPNFINLASKPVTIEPAVVNKIIKTKHQTDQAFDTLKRKLSRSRSNSSSHHQSKSEATPHQASAPHFIQPTKHISTVVSSGSNSQNQLPQSQLLFTGSHQTLRPMTIPDENVSTSKTGGGGARGGVSPSVMILKMQGNKQRSSTIDATSTKGVGMMVMPTTGQHMSRYQNLQTMSQNNSQQIMEFEKNYKKLSGLLDKIFVARNV